MVMKFEPFEGGWVVVIDFKTKYCKLLVYSYPQYNIQYHEFKAKYESGIFTICVELDDKHYTEYIDDGIYPDQLSNVKYCVIINNSDDETMYSQLCGALMKCAIDMKV